MNIHTPEEGARFRNVKTRVTLYTPREGWAASLWGSELGLGVKPLCTMDTAQPTVRPLYAFPAFLDLY
jgi:hypothetical protein